MAKKIKIFVVDDGTIEQTNIFHTLPAKSHYEVVGNADSGSKAIKLIKKLNPDIVILDMNLIDLNGIRLLEDIKSNHLSVKMVTIIQDHDKLSILNILSFGVSGCLSNSLLTQELYHAIKIVQSGKTYLCPETRRLMMSNSVLEIRKKTIYSDFKLSTRQREVLQLISEGYQSNHIAEKLKISRKTVDNHRSNLKKKLNLHTTAQLTKYAIIQGITSIEI